MYTSIRSLAGIKYFKTLLPYNNVGLHQLRLTTKSCNRLLSDHSLMMNYWKSTTQLLFLKSNNRFTYWLFASMNAFKAEMLKYQITDLVGSSREAELSARRNYMW
jgi:hypothetical protein